jgi:DNA-binding transcriptional LysR family regulator
VLQTLAERALRLAVPAGHPLAAGDSVDVGELRGQRWIAGPASGEEKWMGVWPGLDERPDIGHTARDWLAKLHLVAAGAGITTVSASIEAVAPPGVRILPVHGGPQEIRRIILARLPGRLPEPAARLADALRTAATEVSPPE